MGCEIGDSISCELGAGEVVNFDLGRPVVRPFPRPEQVDWPGKPTCFVAHGDYTILQKHFERTTSADLERQQLEARVRERKEAFQAQFHAAAAQRDRAWYRDRER